MADSQWHAVEYQGTRCSWRICEQSPSRSENASNTRLQEGIKSLKRQQVALFDYSIKTCKGRQIRGWLFQPCEEALQGEPPCGVVYCPSESSGGADAEDVLPIVRKLAPVGISLLCLDVATRTDLQVHAEDVMAGVAVLRQSCERVALWGHGQGAVSALRCAQLDPSLAALVSDSAYCELPEMILPSWAFNGWQWLSSSASVAQCSSTSHTTPKDLTGLLDMNESQVPVLAAAARSFVPAMFIHGDTDTIVPKSHAQSLQQAYGGEAQLILVPHHDGQTTRPPAYIAKGALFLVRAFLKVGNCDLAKSRIRELEGLSDVKMGPRKSKFKATDQEIKDFLESQDGRERRQGILLAGINAVEAYLHAESYTPVETAGQWSEDGSTFRCAAEATLPDRDSSVAIVWAADLPSQGPGGLLFFAFVAPSHISIVRIRIRAGTPDAKAQIYNAKAGMVATLRQNTVQIEQHVGTHSPIDIELMIKLVSGTVELKVGEAFIEEYLLPEGGLELNTPLEAPNGRRTSYHNDFKWAKRMSFWRATFNRTLLGGHGGPSGVAPPKADLEFEAWGQEFRPREDEFVGEVPKCPWSPEGPCEQSSFRPRINDNGPIGNGVQNILPSFGPFAGDEQCQAENNAKSTLAFNMPVGGTLLTNGSKCISEAGANGSLEFTVSDDASLRDPHGAGFSFAPLPHANGMPRSVFDDATSPGRRSTPTSNTPKGRQRVSTADFPDAASRPMHLPVLLAGVDMQCEKARDGKPWAPPGEGDDPFVDDPRFLHDARGVASVFPESLTWPEEIMRKGGPIRSWQHEGQMR